MADFFLDEFLFRGRPPGSDQPNAFHVVLGMVDPFGRIVLRPAMTPEQAEEKGFGLPTIIATLDKAALHENDLLREQAEDAQNQLKAAQDEATRQCQDMQRQMQAAQHESARKIEDLRSRLEAAEARAAAPAPVQVDAATIEAATIAAQP